MEFFSIRTNRSANTAGNDATDSDHAILDELLITIDAGIAIVLIILGDDLDLPAIDTACVIDFLGGERHAVTDIHSPGGECAGQIGQLTDLDRACRCRSRGSCCSRAPVVVGAEVAAGGWVAAGVAAGAQAARSKVNVKMIVKTCEPALGNGFKFFLLMDPPISKVGSYIQVYNR